MSLSEISGNSPIIEPTVSTSPTQDDGVNNAACPAVEPDINPFSAEPESCTPTCIPSESCLFDTPSDIPEKAVMSASDEQDTLEYIEYLLQGVPIESSDYGDISYDSYAFDYPTECPGLDEEADLSDIDTQEAAETFDLGDLELFSQLNDTYNLGIDFSNPENITDSQLELLNQAYLLDTQSSNLQETKEAMLSYFDTLGIADKAYDGLKEIVGLGVTKDEVEEYYNNEENKQEFLTFVVQNGGEITVDSETLENLQSLSKYSGQDISNVKEGDTLDFNQAYKLATGADYNPELISQVMQSQDAYAEVVQRQENALVFEEKMANYSPKEALQYFSMMSEGIEGTTGEELFNKYYQTMFEQHPEQMSFKDNNGLSCSGLSVQDGYLWQELSFPEGYSNEDKEFIAQSEFLYSKQDEEGNTKYYKVVNLENEQQVLSNISGKDDTYDVFGFGNTYENSPIAMFNKANNSIKDNNLYLEQTKQGYNEEYGDNAFDTILEEFPKMQQEAFGKNILAEKLGAYQSDMDSYASKLSQAASLGCFAASFIPGVNIGIAPILISAGIDNAIDLANLSTNNKDGEIGQWTKNLALEAGMFAVGMGINRFANIQGNKFVANKIARGSQFVMNHAAGVEAAAEYAIDNMASVVWDLGKGLAAGSFTGPDGTFNSKALLQMVGSNLLFNAADLRNGMSLYRSLAGGNAVDIGNGVKFQIDDSTGSVKYSYPDNSQVKIENGSAVKINPDGTTTDLKFDSATKSWMMPDGTKINLTPEAETKAQTRKMSLFGGDSQRTAKIQELGINEKYIEAFEAMDKKAFRGIADAVQNPATRNLKLDLSDEATCKRLVELTNRGVNNSTVLSAFGRSNVSGEFYQDFLHTLDSIDISKIKDQSALFEFSNSIGTDSLDLKIKMFNSGIDIYELDEAVGKIQIYNRGIDLSEIDLQKIDMIAGCTDLSAIDGAHKLSLLINEDETTIRRFCELNDSKGLQYYDAMSIAKLDDASYSRAMEMLNVNKYNANEIKYFAQLDAEQLKNAQDLMSKGLKIGDATVVAKNNSCEQALNLMKQCFSSEQVSTLSLLSGADLELGTTMAKNGYSSHAIKLAVGNQELIDTMHKYGDILSTHQMEQIFINDNMRTILNNASEEDLQLISAVNKSSVSDVQKDELFNAYILKDAGEANRIKPKTQTMCETMSYLKNVLASEGLSDAEKQIISSKVSEIDNKLRNVFTPTAVSKEARVNMMKGFFANNNPKLDELLSNTDFAQFGREGLPLTYSRTSFLGDLDTALKGVDDAQKTGILQKLGITTITDSNGSITGYDGVIDLTKLSTDGTEGEVLKLAQKFITGNSVNTGNAELDSALNSLIEGMPEFINIIGKQQHGTQDLSVDAHILTVLKGVIGNDKYQDLSRVDQTCLKFATVLHDIAKSEGIVDTNHAQMSSLYARSILGKDSMNMSLEMQNRICELIQNHHWLADYNNGIKTADEVAVMFRRPDDLQMAQILAEADLKGVKTDGSFYDMYSDALSRKKQAPIINAIAQQTSSSQIFLTSKVIDPKKLPQTEINGESYSILDFTKMPNGMDLSKYGFEPGTTPENLRLLVHMASDQSIDDLRTVFYLGDSSKDALLCSSRISLENKNTYYNYRYGLVLEGENVNIANATPSNQASGCGKGYQAFKTMVSLDINRETIPSVVQKKLGLSESGLSELFTQLKNVAYQGQIKDEKIYMIEGREFKGAQIKKALNIANDAILNKAGHNELNIYSPKATGIVVKANSPSEIPAELLKMSKEFNVPIYIIGE